MNDVNEQFVDKLLQSVEEKVQTQPDALMLFVAECTAFLAMHQVPAQSMARFEREANRIMDTYMTFELLEPGIIRGKDMQ